MKKLSAFGVAVVTVAIVLALVLFAALCLLGFFATRAAAAHFHLDGIEAAFFFSICVAFSAFPSIAILAKLKEVLFS